MKVNINGCPFCGEAPKIERFFCEDCSKNDYVSISCECCGVSMKKLISVGSKGDDEIELFIGEKWNQNVLSKKLKEKLAPLYNDSFYDTESSKLYSSFSFVKLDSYKVDIEDHTR